MMEKEFKEQLELFIEKTKKENKQSLFPYELDDLMKLSAIWGKDNCGIKHYSYILLSEDYAFIKSWVDNNECTTPDPKYMPKNKGSYFFIRINNKTGENYVRGLHA